MSFYYRNNEISQGYRIGINLLFNDFNAKNVKGNKLVIEKSGNSGVSTMGPMNLPIYSLFTFVIEFELPEPIPKNFQPLIGSKSVLKLTKVSKVVYIFNPNPKKPKIKTIVPIYSLNNLKPSQATHPKVLNFYLIYLCTVLLHFILILWNFSQILDDTKHVRNIPFYPRLFCIFMSAIMAIVGAFMVGKWLLVAAIETTFMLIDGTLIFVLSGTSYEDYCKRWVTGWSGTNNLGTGFRPNFLESLGIERTADEVREYLMEER